MCWGSGCCRPPEFSHAFTFHSVNVTEGDEESRKNWRENCQNRMSSLNKGCVSLLLQVRARCSAVLTICLQKCKSFGVQLSLLPSKCVRDDCCISLLDPLHLMSHVYVCIDGCWYRGKQDGLIMGSEVRTIKSTEMKGTSPEKPGNVYFEVSPIKNRWDLPAKSRRLVGLSSINLKSAWVQEDWSKPEQFYNHWHFSARIASNILNTTQQVKPKGQTHYFQWIFF